MCDLFFCNNGFNSAPEDVKLPSEDTSHTPVYRYIVSSVDLKRRRGERYGPSVTKRAHISVCELVNPRGDDTHQESDCIAQQRDGGSFLDAPSNLDSMRRRSLARLTGMRDSHFHLGFVRTEGRVLHSPRYD